MNIPRASLRWPAPAAIAAAALTFALAPATHAGAAVSHRVIAITGDAAPGAHGAAFLAFTTPLNHDIMSPRIDAAGNVLFEAFVDIPGVAENGGRAGVWIDRGGALSLVALSGDPAPGTPEGSIFAGVPSEYIPFPPAFGGGAPALQGALLESSPPGGRTGLWTLTDQDELILLSLQGEQAPGAPVGALLGSISGLINEGRGVIAFADLSGAGVTTANNEAVFTAFDGPLALALREGDAAPVGSPGVVYGPSGIGATRAFVSTASNRHSDLVYEASLAGAGVGNFNDEAIFVDRGHGPALYLREGDPAPPGAPPGASVGGGSVRLSVHDLQINDSGHIAFNARLGGGVPTQTAMFSDHRGSLEVVLTVGAPAPGAGGNFTIVGSPVLSNAGRLAFTATTLTGQFPPMGVWREENGAFAPVVLPGDIISAGGVNGAFNGVAGIIGFASSGMLAFRASVNDAQFGFVSGVFLALPDGEILPIAVSGRPFDLHGDGVDVRIAVRVVAGGLSETGAVALRLDFDDGSSAHIVAGASLPSLGDLDGDGLVGASDLATMLGQWGPAPAGALADLNGDGAVNAADLALLLGAWGA